MDYCKEPYPENVNALVQKAYKLAEIIQDKLNVSDCVILADLYTEKNKRMHVNKSLFKTEGFDPDKRENFKGIYVFGELNKKTKIIEPVYIGITRVGYDRLRNHGWGKTAATCTLAYLMAKNINSKLTSKTVNHKKDLEPHKKDIIKYKVHLIPEEEDYDLYFLEVAIAGILKTKWNSFRTH